MIQHLALYTLVYPYVPSKALSAAKEDELASNQKVAAAAVFPRRLLGDSGGTTCLRLLV